MRRFLAGSLTSILMAGLLWSGLRQVPVRVSPLFQRPDVPASPVETPDPAEARVRELLDHATQGNVPGYLDSFDTPLRLRLERDASERGLPQFSADLRRASSARKSHAVFSAEPDGAAAARVTVETVYPDRNERQTYRVVNVNGSWLVADVETSHTHEPNSKFGSSATHVAPEGVPLQGMVTVESGDDPAVSAGERAGLTP